MTDPKNAVQDFIDFMNSDETTPQDIIEHMGNEEMQKAVRAGFRKMSFAADKWFLDEFKLEDTPENRQLIKEFKSELRSDFEEK